VGGARKKVITPKRERAQNGLDKGKGFLGAVREKEVVGRRGTGETCSR